MTWSEAKEKSGQGTKYEQGKKKNVVQVNHAQALTAKIVRKNTSAPEFTKTELRRANKREEKRVALANKMADQRLAERLERESRTVCPLDMAKEQMATEAKKWQSTLSLLLKDNGGGDVDGGPGCELDSVQLAQCREMQLDEIAALEAIYADTDEFLLGANVDVDGLRAKVDEWQDGGGGSSDDGEGTPLSYILQHPPLNFGLQLVIEDEHNQLGEGMDLVATLLLYIVLPSSYPESGLPRMTVAYVAVSDRSVQMASDKAYESLAHLEEERLIRELMEQAREILPMPCVYELAATWLTEHLFEYFTLRTHAQISG